MMTGLLDNNDNKSFLRRLYIVGWLCVASFSEVGHALTCNYFTQGYPSPPHGSAGEACNALQPKSSPIAKDSVGHQYSCAGVAPVANASVYCEGACVAPMVYNAASGECQSPDDTPGCDEKSGHPIVLSTGAKTLKEVDYRYAGDDPLAIEREYLYVPGNGEGKWRFKYMQSIKTGYVKGSSLVRFSVERGLDEAYPFQAEGALDATVSATSTVKYSPYKLEVHFNNAPLADNFPELIRPLSFVLYLPDGGTETYDHQGKLTSITNSAGLVKTITYPTTNQVVIKDEATGLSIAYALTGQRIDSATIYPSGVVQPLVYAYDYTGKNLTTVTYPDSGVVTYAYGDGGTLVSKQDEYGKVYLSWSYADAVSGGLPGRAVHSHLGDTNAEGIDIGYTTDVDGFVTDTHVTNVEGLVTHYQFSVDSVNKASVLKHVGGESTSSCAPPDSYMTYDSNRKRTTLTTGALDNDDNGVPESEGVVTRYERNDATRAHLVTAVTTGLQWASGATKPWQAGTVDPAQTQETAAAQRIETDWHSVRELPVSIRYKGKTTTTAMTLYRTVSFTYDEAGSRCTNAPQATYRVCSKTITDNTAFANAASGPRTWSYTYTMQGGGSSYELAGMTITDPRNAVTSYAYDIAGQLAGITSPSINGVQQTLGFTNYNQYGLPNGMPGTVAENGVVTSLIYNTRGQLETTTTAGASTYISHWPNGLVKRVTQPDASYLEYTYNPARQLVSVVNQRGEHVDYTPSVLNGEWTQATTYKATGTALADVTLKQQREFDALGRLYKQQDADDTDKVIYGHDQNDNLTNIIELGNGINALAYDNNSRVTYRTYDGQNRLETETRCADPGTSPPLLCNSSPLVTHYTYDAQGNIATVTDAEGHITSYTYNGFGELVTQVSPDTGTTRYVYDKAGNLTEKTKAYGTTDDAQVITYSWDALNRLTGIDYPGTAQDVIYTWDESGHGSGIGRLTTVADESGSTGYSYNAHGLVTSKQFIPTGTGGSPPPPTLTTHYAYTAYGTALDVVTLPGGQQIQYPRTNGVISGITTNGTTTINGGYNLLTALTRQPFGSVSGWQTNSGGTYLHSRTYDANGRLLQRAVVDGNDASIASAYEYDSYSHISAQRRIGDANQDEVYEYDSQARLTKVTAQYGRITYEYNAVGNRTSRLMERQDPVTQEYQQLYSEGYGYQSGNNRLSSITRSRGANTLRSRSFIYDARGNTITDTRSKTVGITTATDTLHLDYGNSDRLNTVDVQ